MSERVDRDDPVISAIKRLAPTSIKAHLRDGTEKAVALSKAGNKWARLADTLDSLPWERLEALDKNGAVLGVVDSQDDSDYVEVEGESPGTIKEAMRVMLEVMRTTMKETRLMFDVQLKGQAELVQAMTEGMRSVQESYTIAMRVQATQQVAAAGEGNDEVMNMLKMAAMQTMMKPSAPPRQVTATVTKSTEKKGS